MQRECFRFLLPLLTQLTLRQQDFSLQQAVPSQQEAVSAYTPVAMGSIRVGPSGRISAVHFQEPEGPPWAVDANRASLSARLSVI